MKASEIKVGLFYDGKKGLREVISCTPDTVTYVVLAAASEFAYDYVKGETIKRSLIGGEHTCTLKAFASWATVRLSNAKKDEILMGLAASKIKITELEHTTLVLIAKNPGAARLFKAEAKRLAKKNLVMAEDHSKITKLGQLRLKIQAGTWQP